MFATPNGHRPHALPPSLDPNFIDPPLGRSVVTAEVAKQAREIEESYRLDNPHQHIGVGRASGRTPATRTTCASWRRTTATLGDKLAEQVAEYDALLIVGGSGPIVDLANNGRVHDLILAFLRAGKPIGAECYGVACLAFARDWDYRQSIIWGKHVTGHCKEYDYKDGTGFLDTDFNMGPPPYPLEYILRDATGPDGRYHGNFGKETIGDRGLPVHHRPLHSGLLPDRRKNGRGAGARASPLRLVTERAVHRVQDQAKRQ